MNNIKKFISVYIPLNLPKQYTYYYFDHDYNNIGIGSFIQVGLGKKEVIGIVVKYLTIDDLDIPEDKIKPIINIINIPSLSPQFIKFLSAMSAYTLTNIGLVFKLAINNVEDIINKGKYVYKINQGFNFENSKRKHKSIAKVLEVYSNNYDKSLSRDEILQQAHIGSNTLSNLIKDNFLIKEKVFKSFSLQENLNYHSSIILQEEQMQVAKKIKDAISIDSFNPIVLQGVPGSGKTEVYFDILHDVLKQGKQVLILLPEIGLTSQVVERFKSRFGFDPYIWHSDISKVSKREAWLAATDGSLRIIIGARSALFLPYKRLGLIIVDEEHDSSYKQEEGVIYNAKDMAVLRSSIEKIPILLVSATPSLETYNNIVVGKYKRFNLLSRYNNSILPNIELVNLLKDGVKKDEICSPYLIEAITQTLNNQEQALLFLNKRGYVSNIYCKNSMKSRKCLYCSTNLVYHKYKNIVVCHYCGYKEAFCDVCKTCGGEIAVFGFGVEKVKEYIDNKFPDKKSIILSSDTISSYKKAIEIVQDINNKKYDILIGTQIISKGYHFPYLTLVGILNADTNNAVDLKSNEKSWQMLYQVAGRSGRESNKGRVILQFFDENNPVINSLKKQNYEEFLQIELQNRKLDSLPPFNKLIAVIFSCDNEEKLKGFCNHIKIAYTSKDDGILLGPTEAPIYLLRGKYRMRFLLHTYNGSAQNMLKKWLHNFVIPSNIKIQIDVDPISFY